MAPSASDVGGGDALTVSVIICTKDRPDDLSQAIASVRACDTVGQHAEIVVVEEAESPRALPGVCYVHLPREGRGFGYARNVGVGAATGKILAFLDDDCAAEAGWLESLTNPLRENPHILGVAGAVLVRDCNLIGYAENILGFPGGGLRFLHAARGSVVPTRYLSTCNCAYRREAILQAGGFLEGARLGGEDYLLAERVSSLGPCVYAPAVVYHRPRERFNAIWRWFMRRGESEVFLLSATASRARYLRFLLRSSWTLRALIFLGVVILWPQLAALVPLIAIVYYGVILHRFRFALAYPFHRRAWWLVPVVKLTMDLGSEFGRWRGLLRPAGR